jgi:hypothetical protein
MKKKDQIFQTTTCKICNGLYINAGQCPSFGLKFRNSPCPAGETVVHYIKVKTRNNVPWWKFWKKHYDLENVIISNPNV